MLYGRRQGNVVNVFARRGTILANDHTGLGAEHETKGACDLLAVHPTFEQTHSSPHPPLNYCETPHLKRIESEHVMHSLRA
jgi:hypothetical protein